MSAPLLSADIAAQKQALCARLLDWRGSERETLERNSLEVSSRPSEGPLRGPLSFCGARP